MRVTRALLRTALVVPLLAVGGCGDGGAGDARILLESEESILSGIVSGAEPENLQDGWNVHFDKYVVAVGGIALERSTDPSAIESSTEVRVVDLTTVPSRVTLTLFEGIESGRWDRVSYELVPPTAGATRDASVDPADFDAMVANGWTYLIEGTLEEAALGTGESCPPRDACVPAPTIGFRFATPLSVRFSNCESEGAAQGGFSVPRGGETTQSATLHGDHVFFDAFPGGAEVVVRRAQWLANADVDGDAFVDLPELEGIGLVDLPSLFPSSDYNLSGSPVTPFDSADDWVRGQLATQGHWNGEGECLFALLP